MEKRIQAKLRLIFSLERETVQTKLSSSLPDYLGGTKEKKTKENRSDISLVSPVIFQHVNKKKDHDMNKLNIGQYHSDKIT